MYSALCLCRIHLLQFDLNNTQFVIAFSPVVDCCVGLFSFRSVVDASKRDEKKIGSLLLLIVAVRSFSFRFVDDVVPCHTVG